MITYYICEGTVLETSCNFRGNRLSRQFLPPGDLPHAPALCRDLGLGVGQGTDEERLNRLEELEGKVAVVAGLQNVDGLVEQSLGLELVLGSERAEKLVVNQGCHSRGQQLQQLLQDGLGRAGVEDK